MSSIMGAKAISLVAAGGIAEDGFGRLFYARGSGGQVYRVTRGSGVAGLDAGEWGCTCRAGQAGRPCYHAAAAALMIAQQRTAGDQQHRVLDIRLTALADAIRSRDFEQVEFEYDRIRSTLDRTLGVRARPADLMRAEGME